MSLFSLVDQTDQDVNNPPSPQPPLPIPLPPSNSISKDDEQKADTPPPSARKAHFSKEVSQI